ncbi:MAG TPA: hypothetical protein VGG48_03750 [Rhizomicrobium sp.]
MPRRSGGRIEQELEAQIAAFTAQIASTLEAVNAIAPDEDETGQAKLREMTHAIAMAKMSAQLATAVAKLKGQYQHAITVRRLDPILIPVTPVDRTPTERELLWERMATPTGPFPHPDDLWRLEPALLTREELPTITNEELFARMERLQAERAGFFE